MMHAHSDADSQGCISPFLESALMPVAPVAFSALPSRKCLPPVAGPGGFHTFAGPQMDLGEV